MTQAVATRTINGVEVPTPGAWIIDPAHSSVGFIARYLMVSKVRGQFEKFWGSLHIGQAPEDSSVEVTIESASINTNHPDRDTHLKSPDFLDVERFPTITFRSVKVELTGNRKLKVTGDLTIRDQTRRVVLDGEFLGLTTDPFGNPRVFFSAAAEIDREEFGASWNQALETGGVLVGRQVQIELEVQAIRQREES